MFFYSDGHCQSLYAGLFEIDPFTPLTGGGGSEYSSRRWRGGARAPQTGGFDNRGSEHRQAFAKIIRAHGPPLREGAAFVSPGWYLDRWRVVRAQSGFGSMSAWDAGVRFIQ